MTRPKRSERILDDILRTGMSPCLCAMADRSRSLLRGACRCRDNAARYRAELDEARQDCVAIRARMGIDLDRARRDRDAERARADAAERLCVELAPFVSAWRKTPTPLPPGWREQVEAMRERQGR